MLLTDNVDILDLIWDIVKPLPIIVGYFLASDTARHLTVMWLQSIRDR